MLSCRCLVEMSGITAGTGLAMIQDMSMCYYQWGLIGSFPVLSCLDPGQGAGSFGQTFDKLQVIADFLEDRQRWQDEANWTGEASFTAIRLVPLAALQSQPNNFAS